MQIGEKYLITAEDWFFAPDGENYRAVFGTVHGVIDAAEALGVKANARSTNWYVLIGDMLLAGCRVHYVLRADHYNPRPSVLAEIDHDGLRLVAQNATSRIYNADATGLIAHGKVST